jgi:Zn-dependent protease
MNFLTQSPLFLLRNGDFKGFLLSLLYLLPALVIAISFHEAAHAWMANRMGDPTAKNMGRLTLDPTKHFTAWGIVMMVLIGFGFGKAVPTNPRNYYNYKKGNILVAIAGVTTNLILSFIFYGIYILIFAVFRVNSEPLFYIIFNIVLLNIVLCFFNLIPVPPLDGHHLIKGFIARRSPDFYLAYQKYGFLVLMVIMILTDYIQIAIGFLTSQVLNLYGLFYGLFV